MGETGLITSANRSPGGVVIPAGQSVSSDCTAPTTLPPIAPNQRYLRVNFPVVVNSVSPWNGVPYDIRATSKQQISSLFDSLPNVSNYVFGECQIVAVNQYDAWNLVNSLPSTFSYYTP